MWYFGKGAMWKNLRLTMLLALAGGLSYSHANAQVNIGNGGSVLLGSCGVSSPCTVTQGGTGATTAPAALANLGGWMLPLFVGTPPSGSCPTNNQAAFLTSGGMPYPEYICASNVWVLTGNAGASGIVTINGQTGPAFTIACGSGLTCTLGTNSITVSLTSAFTITSFTGCSGSLELGQTVTNPTCAATYSGTPASASITNTDSIDSPLVLVSPFTSGTIVGSFYHATVTTTTITLTAIGASTQTATQTYTWKPRIFSGVGTIGASSTATASGTTAVLSNGTVLASAGLGAEAIGQTFGPYAPVGQAVYLLLTGGSHTFTDACSGFPFAFNAPLTVTFVNNFGVTTTMYLYQSTNSLTGSCFSPKVAS